VVSFVEPFSWSQVGCQDITMSDGLKLYAIPNHKNGFKALITAQYAGVSVETPAYEHNVDNKKPEFLKLNPHGKVEPPPVCQVDSLNAIIDRWIIAVQICSSFLSRQLLMHDQQRAC